MAEDGTEVSLRDYIDSLLAERDARYMQMFSDKEEQAECSVDAMQLQMVERMDELSDRISNIEGRSAGYSASWGVVVAIAGVLTGAAGVYLALKP